MKIAVTADVHAHIYREFNKTTDLTGSSRLDQVVNVLRQIKKECLQRGIKHLAIAGDLFHVRGKVATVVFNSIYDEIKTFYEDGIEVLMIPGNHDDNDNSDLPKHSLHAFKDIEGVKVVDTLSVVEFGGQKIACCRYSKNTKMIVDFINSIEDEDVTLLGHLGLSGAFVGKGSYPMQDAFRPSDLRPGFFKFIALGHFHKMQYIEGRNNFFYTGSPLQHSFNDEGAECGFHILDYDTDSSEFIPLDSPKFTTWQYNGGVAKLLGIFEQRPNDFYRIIVEEKHVGELRDSLPTDIQYKLVLTKSYEEKLRMDVRVGMSEEEVVTKYAKENNPDALKIGLQILQEVKANVR